MSTSAALPFDHKHIVDFVIMDVFVMVGRDSYASVRRSSSLLFFYRVGSGTQVFDFWKGPFFAIITT